MLLHLYKILEVCQILCSKIGKTDRHGIPDGCNLILIKGVLHPRPVFWLFMHFSQKLQHIGNKKDMFLIGNIPGNPITALEFH